MKQPIRAFAIGLLTAAIVMLIVNYFDKGSTQDLSEMPIEEVVKELKEQGYRVLTEAEYISLSINTEEPVADNEAQENTESAQSPESEEENDSDESGTEESNTDETEAQEETQEDTKSYTLTIESGMPSSAISNTLEANGIIDNSDEFISYLEDEGYANRIQLGEFTLNSSMSYYDIAEALTR